MNENEMMTKKEIEALARRVSVVMSTVGLQNDLYNFVPSPDKLNNGEIGVRYTLLNNALGNIFELNQHLGEELDDIASALYALSEQIEQQKNDHL